MAASGSKATGIGRTIWQQAPLGIRGQARPEMAHYLNTSVRHLFKRGDAGVFKYVNC